MMARSVRAPITTHTSDGIGRPLAPNAVIITPHILEHPTALVFLSECNLIANVEKLYFYTVRKKEDWSHLETTKSEDEGVFRHIPIPRGCEN